MKWLKKRILPIFGRNEPLALRQIELNDASKYEEVAKTSAIEFYTQIKEKY